MPTGAVSQVKMNWLWVRATRGRAYGSDEAENWPQWKTESEGERKTSHKKRKKEKEKAEGERKGDRERESELREKQLPEIQASINGAENACIVAANSELVYKYWVSTGLPFNVCSVCLIHYVLGLNLSELVENTCETAHLLSFFLMPGCDIFVSTVF